MPTVRETLRQRRDIERRAVGRTTINRDVLMFFTARTASTPVVFAMSPTMAQALD